MKTRQYCLFPLIVLMTSFAFAGSVFVPLKEKNGNFRISEVRFNIPAKGKLKGKKPRALVKWDGWSFEEYEDGGRLYKNGFPCQVILSPDEKDIYMLGTASGKIWRASRPKWETAELVSLCHGTSSAFAIDFEAKMIFMAGYSGESGGIYCCDLDGKNQKKLPIDGIKQPCGISLDQQSKKIYWTDYASNSVCCANYDGSSKEAIVKDLEKPRQLAIDTVHNWLFVGVPKKIVRVALDDTTNIKTVANARVSGVFFLSKAEAIVYTTYSGTIRYYDVVTQERSTFLRSDEYTPYASYATLSTKDLRMIQKRHERYIKKRRNL